MVNIINSFLLYHIYIYSNETKLNILIRCDKLTGRTIPIGPDHNCYTVSEPVGVCALVVNIYLQTLIFP